MVLDPITTNIKVTVKLFGSLQNFTIMNTAENRPTKIEVSVIIHQLSSYHIQGDLWTIQK